MTGLVATALMVIFLVVRHTRTEEETGRAELLRATVLGRHAAVLATTTVAAAASLVVGALDATVLVAGGLDVSGSLLHGAVQGATGLVFTGVAAATAQISSSGRGAVGLAGATLAVLFVVRGVGDVADNMLTWFSPLGWALMAQPYGAARWWVLIPLALLLPVLILATGWLTAHRDAGAGLVQPRPGPPRARARLGTSTGLAWRLQRGSLIGWGVGLLLGSVLFGSVAPELTTMMENNPELQQFFVLAGTDPVSAFLGISFGLMAVIASGFSVGSALRLRAEESAGRAESLLSTQLSRTRWALGSLAVTVTGTVVLMLLVGLGASVSYALVTGETDSLGRFAAAPLALVPAILVAAGLAVLLQGWAPRWSAGAFALVVFTFLQVYLGGLLDFPAWVNGISPFHHLPQMPIESFAPGPTAAVLAGRRAAGGRRPGRIAAPRHGRVSAAQDAPDSGGHLLGAWWGEAPRCMMRRCPPRRDRTTRRAR